ncbi:MAG TPA: glycosyltransferase, partial [Gemmataceae bacterium]|nr:glycosyltransferase [Gemmataceae bacterium]
FFGGPERQILGLAEALRPQHETCFLSFAEHGRCRDFLLRAQAAGFPAQDLHHDSPHLLAAVRELTKRLVGSQADVMLCHGYKSNILGRIAARRAGLPVLAVSRGWTGENVKVRLYDLLDRFHLRFMDHVVAVSQGQAEKVRRAGVPLNRLTVIRNATHSTIAASSNVDGQALLRDLFPAPFRHIVVSAGRLSPEKGFADLIDAAKHVGSTHADVAFAIFGEGCLRSELQQKINEIGLRERFILPGFHDDLDRLLRWADVFVLPSYTEGLPNVVLEASAAAVPVVATAVGGTPEVVRDGETGFLVSPHNPEMLGERISALLADEGLRRRMGDAGRNFVQSRFTFAAQAEEYLRLFEEMGISLHSKQEKLRLAA